MVARLLNVCKEYSDLFFTGIARERLRLAQEVPLRNDRAWPGNIVDDEEEVIEGAKRRQPTVDGEGRKSLREAVMDVSIHITKTDGGGQFASIRKEERQVAHVVLPDARMRVLAAEPVLELGEFEVHGGLLFEEESITQAAKSLHTKGEPNCFQFGSPFG